MLDCHVRILIMLLGCGEVCAISKEISEDEAEFLIFLFFPHLAFWFVLEFSSGDRLAIDVLQLMGAAVGCSKVGSFATILACWSATAAGGLECWSVGALDWFSSVVLECWSARRLEFVECLNPGLLERWSVGLSCTHLADVAWMQIRRGGAIL